MILAKKIILGFIIVALSCSGVAITYTLVNQPQAQNFQYTTTAPTQEPYLSTTQSASQESQSSDTLLATKIIEECAETITQHDRKTCYESKILTTINDDPTQTDAIFTEIWRLSVQQKISDDPRIFLDAAHDAGMMLESEKIPLLKAFSYCGITFKQGCMHGYVMEYIDDTYPKEVLPKGLKTICEKINDPLSKINCIHGIGHSLAAKIKKDLPEVLSSCKDIAENPTEISACQSGIFMEYTKGTAGSGRHSHNSIGLISLPCKKLPDEYKKVCIASEGAYRQYNSGHEDFKTTYDFCIQSGPEYTPSCMMAVSERAIISTAENAEHSIELCNQLTKKEQINICLESMINVSKTQFTNKNLTSKLEEYQLKLQS